MGSLENRLAEEAAAFAESITPAAERWAYCLRAMSYLYRSTQTGETMQIVRANGAGIAAKLLGGNLTYASALYRLRRLKAIGFDAYNEAATARGAGTLTVGPMQAWNVGHVYFARVASHPHVLKIGFSRRVSDRLEDIRQKTKVGLVLETTKVGTLLDEQWWHHDWRKFRIEGEWFFDPHMTARTVPTFLASHQHEVAE